MSTQRTITVFSTKGEQKKKLETDATTWKELRKLVKSSGYDIDNLHATENINRTNLEHEDANLPVGNFTLFLRPKKTKSGLSGMAAKSFKELRDVIKEQGDACKAYLSGYIPGKNWTQLTTDTLREALSNYNGKATSTAKVAPVKKAVAKAPAIKAAPIKTAKAVAEIVEAVEVNASNTSLFLLTEAKSLITQASAKCTDSKIKRRITSLNTTVTSIIGDLTEESPEAKARRLDKEETDALAKEAADFMKGFN